MKTLHSSFHLNGHSLGVSIKTLIWLDIKILLEIPKWTRFFRERCRCAVESWTTTLRYGLGTVESKIPQLKHFSQLIMIVNFTDGLPHPSPLSTSGKVESSLQVSKTSEWHFTDFFVMRTHIQKISPVQKKRLQSLQGHHSTKFAWSVNKEWCASEIFIVVHLILFIVSWASASNFLNV